jgi:hypothetical protein
MLAIFITLCLVSAISFACGVGWANERRILGEPPEVDAETIIERYLATELDYRPVLRKQPGPRILHIVKGETSFLDDEDPLSLYDDAGIVVSTH